MATYQVIGKIGNSDKIKTIIVQDVFSSNEAMDYAAMFHNIDEIKSITQGELIKGVFYSNTVILYKIIASGFKDYIRLMLGDTEIVYIKTTKANFDFVEQELRHMVDSINTLPITVQCLRKLRGIEAWITPKERHLAKPIYEGIEAFDKTSFGSYINSGNPS